MKISKHASSTTWLPANIQLLRMVLQHDRIKSSWSAGPAGGWSQQPWQAAIELKKCDQNRRQQVTTAPGASRPLFKNPGNNSIWYWSLGFLTNKEQYPLLSRSSTRPQAACESQRELAHSDLAREGSEIQEEMFQRLQREKGRKRREITFQMRHQSSRYCGPAAQLGMQGSTREQQWPKPGEPQALSGGTAPVLGSRGGACCPLQSPTSLLANLCTQGRHLLGSQAFKPHGEQQPPLTISSGPGIAQGTSGCAVEKERDPAHRKHRQKATNSSWPGETVLWSTKTEVKKQPSTAVGQKLSW